MSDNVLESGQPSGVQGQPSPAPSGGGVSSTSPVDVDALAEALAKNQKFLDLLNRSTQSVKDKRFSSIEKEQGSLKSQLTRVLELTKRGLTEEDALFRVRVEDALLAQDAPQEATPVPPQSPPGSGPGVAGDETARVLIEGLGLDPNSAEVLQVLRDHPADIRNQIAKFAELSARRKASPPPNPAAVLPTAAGAPVSAGSELSDIDRQLAALKARPRYQIDKAEYDALLGKRRQLLDQQANK